MHVHGKGGTFIHNLLSNSHHIYKHVHVLNVNTSIDMPHYFIIRARHEEQGKPTQSKAPLANLITSLMAVKNPVVVRISLLDPRPTTSYHCLCCRCNICVPPHVHCNTSHRNHVRPRDTLPWSSGNVFPGPANVLYHHPIVIVIFGEVP